MAKKEKTPLTFEELAREKERKEAKGKLFRRTFLKAFALFASFAIIFFTVMIAFVPEVTYKYEDVVIQNTPASSGTSNSAPVSANTGTGTSTSTSTDTTPASTNNGGSTETPDVIDDQQGETPATEDNQGAAASGLSNSSSADEVVAYFNDAINKVKPNAKQIILVKEENTEAGGIEGLPGMISGLANSLIANNMGVKAENQETGTAEFPVENESWSSQLTAADIESFNVNDLGNAYEITLNILADEMSEETAHGYGHNGKVFSVIMPSIVTDNAGAAAKIISSVKTGHEQGRVIVTVDKESGYVTHANYFFVWKLGVKAMGANVTVPFGLEKDYSISY